MFTVFFYVCLKIYKALLRTQTKIPILIENKTKFLCEFLKFNG